MFGFDDPPETQAGVPNVDLSGKTVLVTGSTSGIGRVGALSLGRLGAEVFVHGRNKKAGQEVVEKIEKSDGTARFLRADFEDPDAVSKLAETVRESVDQLDGLCNNAGGYFTDTEPTELGVNRTFHINHLAPYQLTAELLPVLGEGSRVVTTASIAHRGTTFDIDRLFETTGLSPMAAYCRSKLANIQFSNELARRLERADRNVISNSFHPGVIPGSEFGRAFPGFGTQFWQLFDGLPVFETVEEGAATLVYLVCSPEVAETTGGYFVRCRASHSASQARDPEKLRELWARSAELLEMEEPLAEFADSPESSEE